MFSKTLTSTAALASIALLALTGCGSSTQKSADSSASATASATASAGGSLTVSKSWAKAAESGMTAVFGEVTNNTDKAITITGATSNASEKMTQLHTTELDSSGKSSMKQVESFTIEPGETFALEPGGNHIMVMEMTCSLPAGSTAKVTLETSTGEKISFDAEARDYSGAKEEYAPGEESAAASEQSMDMGDMDMGDMDMDMSDMDMGDMDMDMDMSSHDMHSSSASALPKCA